MKEAIKRMKISILIKQMNVNKTQIRKKFLYKEIKFKNSISQSKLIEEALYKNNRNIKFKQYHQILKNL